MEAMGNVARFERSDKAQAFCPADVGRVVGAGFLDEEVCREWILDQIHGQGEKRCPECHATLSGIALQRFCEGKRICCRACGKFFTALTGTFLAGSHLSYSEVILLAVFLYFRIQRQDIARILHISAETVRLWEIKFQAIERIKSITSTEDISA